MKQTRTSKSHSCMFNSRDDFFTSIDLYKIIKLFLFKFNCKKVIFACHVSLFLVQFMIIEIYTVMKWYGKKNYTYHTCSFEFIYWMKNRILKPVYCNKIFELNMLVCWLEY